MTEPPPSPPDPRVECPTCGRRARVPRAGLPEGPPGKGVRCRGCGARFRVALTAAGGVEVLAPAAGGATAPAAAPASGPVEGRRRQGRRGGRRRGARAARTERAPVRPRPAAGEAPRLAVGERVGRYEIEDLIARGMGAVYRAFDPAANRQVALKVLPASATEEDRRRFQREVEVQGNVRHPNLMPIFDSGTIGGARFFTMELLKDPLSLGDLSDLARSGRAHEDPRLRPVATLEGLVRHVLLPVCLAVHHANADEGVLHRDLKPDNVLVDRVGLQPYVIDFGVCSLLERQNPRLAHLPPETPVRLPDGRLRVTGTLMYMPPEQARGEVDRRGDVWGLGAILHQLVTGAAPLAPARYRAVRTTERIEGLRLLIDQARREGNEADVEEFTRTLREVEAGRERTVEDLQRDVLAARYLPRPSWVPAPLEAVIGKAMAAEPAARYRHARALHDDLLAWLEDRPVRALLERRGAFGRALLRGRQLVTRHRRVTAALVLLAVAAVGLGPRLLPRRSAPSAPETASWLARAREALAAGDLVRAREAARHALALDPAGPEAPALLDAVSRRDEADRATRRATELEQQARTDFAAGRIEEGRRGLAALAETVRAWLLPSLGGSEDPGRPRAEAWLDLASGRRPVVLDAPDGTGAEAIPVDAASGAIRWAAPRSLDGVAALEPGAWVLRAQRERGEVLWPVDVPWGLGPVSFAVPIDPAQVPPDAVYVPGGPVVGLDGPTTVTPLLWDRTEVTVDAYGRFLASLPPEARAQRVPRTAGVLGLPGRPTWATHGDELVPPIGGARRPVEGISFHDAVACARFLGRRLPTAAEWIQAAGGGHGRVSPVGDLRVLLAGDARLDAADLGSADVGSARVDVSPYGVRDLAGNVAEWVDTLTTLRGEHGHVVMGGGYLTSPGRALLTEAVTAPGWQPAAGVGFRCVRPAPAE